MSDEVWTARVKLRAAMKEEMPRYKQVRVPTKRLWFISTRGLQSN